MVLFHSPLLENCELRTLDEEEKASAGMEGKVMEGGGGWGKEKN